MLNEASATHLAGLAYRPEAKRCVCLLPLSGIFWEDEIPDFRMLLKMAEDDRDQIYRLFAIRFSIWDGDKLSHDDQRFWDVARS